MLSRTLFPSFTRCSNVLQHRALAIGVNESTSNIVEKVKVTLIPGDGVGPELCEAVQDIVKQTGIPLEFEELFISGAHHNRSASMDVVAASMKRNNGVALKGVIQRQVRDTDNGEASLNMQLRHKLDLFANVVHIRTMEGIKTRHGKDLDFIVIREQTEGEYSRNEHELVPGVIECLKIMTRTKCERIAKFAFDYATKHNRRKVTAVHKANIMKLGDGLFLKSCEKIAKLYTKIEFEGMIVDNCAMQMVSRPERFDVMVMPNLYGSIGANLAAGLVGGAGIPAGMSIGADYCFFEPGAKHSYTEGSGRNIANPTAMILSCSNMLNHLHLIDYGRALRTAVEKTIKDGKVRTRDLGGYHSTSEFTCAVIENFKL
jgi:isocitrate dehydrogenase (NAD+)